MIFSFSVTDAPCFETHRLMARRVRAGSVSASSILAAYKYIFHIHLLKVLRLCLGSCIPTQSCALQSVLSWCKSSRAREDET